MFNIKQVLGCAGLYALSAFSTFANSSGITAYHWDFGDGNSSTAAKPDHEYKQPGFYQVTLKAFVNDELSYSKQHLVDAVSPVIESFSVSGDTEIKLGERVSLTPQLKTSKPLLLSYVWKTHEGTDFRGDTYEFNATESGTFTLSVSGFFDGREVINEQVSYTISADSSTETPNSSSSQSEGGGSLIWLLPSMFLMAFRRRNEK
ncbi:PKD domain-containing protein [Pseudoalteromonas sp. MTN2-4]|uniref:PKD domain-containing protein n=1 Tax=Pseudoalteromonas sp. MTN2-4 TaxID=3056555 RepID=UPI0036F3E2A7